MPGTAMCALRREVTGASLANQPGGSLGSGSARDPVSKIMWRLRKITSV